jgi:hypothetical protein
MVFGIIPECRSESSRIQRSASPESPPSPTMIAFSKVNDYEWQDEYRFCFSLTDALKYGQTKQQLTIPNMPPGKAIPPSRPAPVRIRLPLSPLVTFAT